MTDPRRTHRESSPTRSTLPLAGAPGALLDIHEIVPPDAAPNARSGRRRRWLGAGIAAAVLVTGVTAVLSGSDRGLVRTGGPTSGSTSTSTSADRDERATGIDATGATSADGGGSTTTTTAGGQSGTEDDEAALPGLPGQITGSGSPGGPASVAVPPPVELAIVEPFAPAAPPAPAADTAPVDLLEFPAPGPIDDFASNAPGCARRCVTTAMVRRSAFNTKLALEVETNVPAHVRVYVSTDAPTVTGGVPSFVGVAPVATSGGLVTSWSHTLSGLDADTTYHLIVKATDVAGRSHSVTGPVHTTGIPDQLVAPGDGCTFQCITAGVATPTDHFDVVDLHVETSTPAELTIAVSTQEPGWIGDSPILPADVPVDVPGGLRESWDLSASGLAPSTTYHVVVRATDAEGRYASRIGSFTTAPEPPATIQVTLEQVTVSYDGDAADVNRGEVELAWSLVDHQVIGRRGEEKMHGGTTVAIDAHNAVTVSLDRGGLMAPIIVNAAERDADGHSNEGNGCGYASNGVVSEPVYNAPCDTRINVAQTGLMTREQIEGLPSCAAYGMPVALDDHRCRLVVSPDLGEEYARFYAVISYRIT